jgi:hypothetical protein
MEVKSIDPRDIDYVEDQRLYRVYFSNRHPDAPEADIGITSEWEISDADLAQVLVWIAENQHDRAYSLYAYSESREGRILRHLMSKDQYGQPTQTKVDA